MRLEEHAKNIREKIVTMIAHANSGHPGGALSAVEIVTTLYFKVMHIYEGNVKEIDRDRFVLSKGHASSLLYAVLAEKGLLKEDLMTFRKVDSKLQGHPNMNYIDGVDMSTGSLGQGFSVAVGMAMANKLKSNVHRVYVLLGDGECEEGQVWEAAMAAAHYQLDNLCAIVDFNGLQIDGNVQDVMNPLPLDKKFEAFGWNVLQINGHQFSEIEEAYGVAASSKEKPTMIIAKTIKGKGISFMENNPLWHGTAPNSTQLQQALKELEAMD